MPRRRFHAVFRCLALALLAVLAGDLLDAACDPLPGGTDVVTFDSAGDSAADACAGTCVADCYCCSAADGPSVVTADDPLDFLQMASSANIRPGPSPTSAPPDQPPTRL